jgi:hypothetical protein
MRIDRVAVVVLALGLAAAAPPASASTLMKMLQTYCVATHARRDDAVKAAEADGFRSFDAPGADESVLKNLNLKDGAVRAKRIGGVTYAVAAGWSEQQGFLGAPVADLCYVLSDAADTGAEAELRSWIGFAPVRDADAPTRAVFLFVDGPDAKRDATRLSEEDARARAREGLVRIVIFDPHESNPVLGYAVTRKADVAADPPADAAAAPAPPKRPFDDFANLCVAHRGSLADTLKAADAGGWMEAPIGQSRRDDFPWPMSDGSARLKSTERDLEILFVGHLRLQIGLQVLIGPYCAIAQGPPNDDLLQSAVAWAGASPLDTLPDGTRYYLFAEMPTGRVPLGDKDVPGLARRLRAGGRVLIFVTGLGRSTDDAAVVGVGTLEKLQQVSAERPDRLASR